MESLIFEKRSVHCWQELGFVDPTVRNKIYGDGTIFFNLWCLD